MMKQLLRARIFGVPLIALLALAAVAFYLYRRRQHDAAAAAAADSTMSTGAGPSTLNPYDAASTLGYTGGGGAGDYAGGIGEGMPLNVYPTPVNIDLTIQQPGAKKPSRHEQHVATVAHRKHKARKRRRP